MPCNKMINRQTGNVIEPSQSCDYKISTTSGGQPAVHCEVADPRPGAVAAGDNVDRGQPAQAAAKIQFNRSNSLGTNQLGGGLC